LPISLINFRQKQHVNGQNPAKQVYKIWCKNFQALPSNHFRCWVIFKPHPVYIRDFF